MRRQKFSEIDAIIVKREIEPLRGKRLKSFIRRDRDFLLTLENEKILISLDPSAYRIHLTERTFEGDSYGFELHLRGFTLVNVRVKKWDRLIYLIFSKDRGLRKLVLAVELTGKHSNLILVSGEGKVVDAFRKVPQSSIRPVVPGIDYTPPPQRHFDPEKLAGFIPWLTPPFGEKIYMALNETIALYCPEKEVYSPIELDCSAKRYFPTYSALLDFYFSSRTKRNTQKGETHARLLQELEKVKNYDLYRIAGEKILSGDFKKEGEFLVIDVNGKEIRVKGEGKPHEAAEELFKKYKKFKRGYIKILRKLGESMPVEKNQAKKVQVEVPYEKFVSPGGFTVYRGKNARGNEIITFEIASPEDYFLHAENSPGSHVIIKTGKKALTEADIEFAAKLALEKSKAAGNLKGTVILTKKKYLKRGDTPGKVLISKILKTVEVRLK